ncbi:MAG: hypothetical protein H7246_16595 [Phycisphaerae bacterium]|nr:hypothetical protein [Saprospiraceae bacterium]
MKKANKIRLDILINDLRLVPTEVFDNFMRERWLPFLNSLDQKEQEEALALLFRDQLKTLGNLAAYVPEMGEETFKAIRLSLEQLTSLIDQKEQHLEAA